MQHQPSSFIVSAGLCILVQGPLHNQRVGFLRQLEKVTTHQSISWSFQAYQPVMLTRLLRPLVRDLSFSSSPLYSVSTWPGSLTVQL